MEDLVKYGSDRNQSIEQFMKLLSREPAKEEIKTNTQANGAKYLSIATIEQTLDSLYSGLWQTTNFRWQVVANEVVGSIDLQVFHPTAQTWITRTGAASAMIQTKRGEAVTVDNKHINTLVKDFPHLKAECIKNAAKSIGSAFGRDLNRSSAGDYAPLSDTVERLTESGQRALELLETSRLSDQEKDKVRGRINKVAPEKMNEIINYLNSKQ